jgi:hypothetical protein
MLSLFILSVPAFPYSAFAATNADFMGSGALLDGKKFVMINNTSNVVYTDLQSGAGRLTDNDITTNGGDKDSRMEYTFSNPATISAIRALGAALSSQINIKFINNLGATVYNQNLPNVTGTLFTFATPYTNITKVVLNNLVINSNLREIELYNQDQIPPTAPTNLQATPSNGLVALAWNASTDNGIVTGYNVYRNGVKVNGVLVTSTSFSIATPNNTNNSWIVKAVDDAGNESSASDPPVTTHYDTISPIAPIGLVSTPQSSGSTLLTWDANTEPDLAGYNVFVNNAKRNGSIVTTEQYLVNSLSPNTVYSMAITALDTSSNESPKSSSVVYFQDTLAPDAPTGVNVVPGDQVLQVNWLASAEPNATYVVYKDGVRVTPSPISDLSLVITGLTNGQSYSIQVAALDSTGNESSKSTAVTGTPIVDSTIPQNVKAKSGEQRVLVSWTAVPGATAYQVYKDMVLVGTTSDTGYTDTDVINGQTYTYHVTATVGGDESPPSNQSTVKSGYVLEFGTNSLPTIMALLLSAFSFAGQFAPYLILIAALLLLFTLVGFFVWLFTPPKPKPKGKGKGKEGLKVETRQRQKRELSQEEKEKRNRDRKLWKARYDKYELLTRQGKISDRDRWIKENKIEAITERLAARQKRRDRADSKAASSRSGGKRSSSSGRGRAQRQGRGGGRSGRK